MKNSHYLATLFFLMVGTAFLFTSCEKEEALTAQEKSYDVAVDFRSPSPLYQINAKAQEMGLNYRLLKAEYLTTGEGGQVGRTLFFSDRGNRQLSGDFVPESSLDGTSDVSFYVDENRPCTDVAAGVSNNAIDRAMATWDGVTCSELNLYEIPFDGRSTGWIAAFFGQLGFPFSGSFEYVSDVTHCGWESPLFFELLGSGGSNSILGVTFTIIFTDSNGNPLDADNNGKSDVAWREIYYNDNFSWQDGATYDIETVALHEAGHGLSQAHFGEAFLSPGNGKLNFAPRAVMNAAYSGVQTKITQTDNAGHCSNWANWPEN